MKISKAPIKQENKNQALLRTFAYAWKKTSYNSECLLAYFKGYSVLKKTNSFSQNRFALTKHKDQTQNNLDPVKIHIHTPYSDMFPLNREKKEIAKTTMDQTLYCVQSGKSEESKKKPRDKHNFLGFQSSAVRTILFSIAHSRIHVLCIHDC